MSNYIYNISSDIPNALLNSERLSNSIAASTIGPSLTSIDTEGNTLTVRFSSNITTEEQETLTALINTHDGAPTAEEIIPQEVKVVEEIPTSAFASKKLSTGQSLFKRVHGVFKTIPANSTETIRLIVPYTQAKINALEIIGAYHGDTANFNVYDNSSGTISTVPNYKLNQFGFNVCMRKDFHKEESQYDADLILGMVLELEYTNSQSTDTTIGANFILHELV